MRRTVAYVVLIALAASLAVPAVVFAKGPPGGKGPDFTPPGQEKKAERTQERSSLSGNDDSRASGPPAAVLEKKASKAQEREEKAEQKAEQAAQKAERKPNQKPGPRENAGSALDGGESTQVSLVSEDETTTPDVPDANEEPRPRGVENALGRILANIERAEARVEAGQRTSVPPGLLRVAAKFLGWLGIDADDGPDAPDDTNGTGPSDEETGTVDPPDGSDEETSTVGPGSDEETVTVGPESD